MSGVVRVAPGATAVPEPESTNGNASLETQPVCSTRAAASIVTVPPAVCTQPVGRRSVSLERYRRFGKLRAVDGGRLDIGASLRAGAGSRRCRAARDSHRDRCARRRARRSSRPDSRPASAATIDRTRNCGRVDHGDGQRNERDGDERADHPERSHADRKRRLRATADRLGARAHVSTYFSIASATPSCATSPTT